MHRRIAIPFQFQVGGAIQNLKEWCYNEERRKVSEVATRPKQSWIFCSLALWNSRFELTSKTPMFRESHSTLCGDNTGMTQHNLCSWAKSSKVLSLATFVMWCGPSKNDVSHVASDWSVCHWLSRNAVWRAKVGLIRKLVGKDLLSICLVVSRNNRQHHSR